MTQKSKTNLFSYSVLILVIIIVHFIFILNPEVVASPSQAAIFSWKGIAVVGLLGLIGIFFLNLSNLRGLWDADITIKQKSIIPYISGLLIGAIFIIFDLFTGFTAFVAESFGVESIHIPFPYSIPMYLGGAIIVNIIYYLVLIPLVVYLVSDKLLKGKAESVVFWSIGIPIIFIEPLTSGGLEIATQFIQMTVLGLLFNFLIIWFMRKYGFIAGLFVRIGFYSVWHILYGLF